MYDRTENYMTPARAAMLARRDAAVMRARKREREESQRRARWNFPGVLPPGHPAHVLRERATAGLLLANGAVHTFDREEYSHADYAEFVLGGLEVDSGVSYGDDGWAFYMHPAEREYMLSDYMLPEGMSDGVRALLLQHYGAAAILDRSTTTTRQEQRAMSAAAQNLLDLYRSMAP